MRRLALALSVAGLLATADTASATFPFLRGGYGYRSYNRPFIPPYGRGGYLPSPYPYYPPIRPPYIPPVRPVVPVTPVTPVYPPYVPYVPYVPPYPVYTGPTVITGVTPFGVNTAGTTVYNTAFSPARTASMSNGTMHYVRRPVYGPFGNITGYKSGWAWRDSATGVMHFDGDVYTPNGTGGVNDQHILRSPTPVK